MKSTQIIILRITVFTVLRIHILNFSAMQFYNFCGVSLAVFSFFADYTVSQKHPQCYWL